MNSQFYYYLQGVDESDREEAIYRFLERSGIIMDNGATKTEADELAWKELNETTVS